MSLIDFCESNRANRKSSTRGSTRNHSQAAYTQSAGQQMQGNMQFNSQQQMQQPSMTKKQSNDGRVQKDVIIRKNSSKSLLPQGAVASQQQQNSTNMPNISNIKSSDKSRGVSQPNKQIAGPNGVLLLNTESMDRETANTSKIGATTGSHHKRVASNSNTNNYVKVHNSQDSTEIMSQQNTSAEMFQGAGLPNGINNYTTAGNGRVGGGIPHTLGSNSLGNNQKQSLNMSNYGGYFSAI